MKLKNKLMFGFGSILGLMSIVVIVLIASLGQQNSDMSEIVKNRYEKYKLATEIASENNAIARQVRDFLLDPQTYTPENVELIKESSHKVTTAASSLLRLADQDEEVAHIARIQDAHLAYFKGVEQAIAHIQEGNMAAAQEVIVSDVKRDRQLILEHTAILKNLEHQAMTEVLAEANNNYQMALRITLIFFAVTLALGILVTAWVVHDFTRSVRRVTTAISSVAEGYTDQLPRIENISPDEFGKIAKAFNTMAHAIEEHTRQEEEFRTILQDQNWVESRLSEVMRRLQAVQDVETLGDLLITTLTPMVNAHYGVIYFAEGEGKEQRLKKLAAYAYNDTLSQDSFAVGEGLVGQCAADHRQLLITDLPADYIRSGLGTASPNQLLVFPIEFDGQVRAVVEIATLHEFTPLHLTLIERLSSSIGITFDNVVRQVQIKKLLEQSQALTEELQSQSEELQLQHEELRTVNDQLEKQYRESEQKTRELEVTKRALEEKARQLAINSQFKSEFLANMSHELRTPLNSMLILAQILAENSEGNLTPKQVEHAHAIHLAGRDLLNLINDVLDLAKIESGKMELCPTRVSLHDLVTYIRHQFYPIAERQSINFEIELDKDLPEILFTDERRLMQILKNLLSNAFKFTEQGEVRLTIRHPQPQDFQKPVVPPNTFLVFSVSDTGIGIPEAKQDIIFEAFKQADGTTSRKYGGTGLGLSISREIAQALGSHIGVESVEGKGSTFTLYLTPYFLEDSSVNPNSTGSSRSSGYIHQHSAFKSFDTPHPLDITAHTETDAGELSPENSPTEAKTLEGSLPAPSRPITQDSTLTASTAPGPLLKIAAETAESEETNTPSALNEDTNEPGVLNIRDKGTSDILIDKNVLIVDDDMRNIFALTTLLENYGVNVLVAENGQEALETLTAHPEVDLVLMDIMMPEMDGYQAMEAIRRMEKFQDLPIIALTAKAMKYDREKCLEAGASDYISKPIDVNQLLSLIQVWLYQAGEKHDR